MVRLIHDEQIPPRRERLRGARRIIHEQRRAGDDQLAVEERVRLRVVRLDGRAALFIEDAEEQIETPQQFHEPLMNQRLRHEHQHAGGPAREVQPMQDESGLDRFAQAHFIRQKHARHEAASHFARDRHLVRNQIHPPADIAAHGRSLNGAPALQNLRAQGESIEFIHLAGEQPLLRRTEADRIGKFRLRRLFSCATINEKALLFLDGFHEPFDSVCSLIRSPSLKRTRRSGADFIE